MTLVTRDRLLTLGMLVLCAVAAFLLVRSDVVEGLLARFGRLRAPKKPEHNPYPKPKHELELDDEPHLMLLHESLSSDSSETSDAADPVIEDIVEDPDPVAATACASASAPRAPQKRAPRKPRAGKSSS